MKIINLLEYFTKEELEVLYALIRKLPPPIILFYREQDNLIKFNFKEFDCTINTETSTLYYQ